MSVRCTLMVALALVACEAADHQTDAPTGDASLALRDTFRIPPDEADLTMVGYVTIAPDARMVVTQPRDGQIKVFADSGPPLVVGRSGEGPGEFSNLTRIGWVGDTLWALDPNLMRVSRFDRDFTFLGATPHPMELVSGDGVADTAGGASGRFVQALLPGDALRILAPFSPSRRPRWAAGIDSGSNPLLRVTQDGRIVRRLAVVPPDRCMVRYAIGSSGSGMSRIPFCSGVLETSWDGGAEVAVLVVTPPEEGDPSYALTIIDANGDTTLSRSYPYTPIPVTPRAIDSLRARVESTFASLPQSVRDARPDLAPAETYPPVRRLVLGRDHTVWLEEQRSEAGHHWLVLSPAGDPVGRVSLPPNVVLKAAERGTIWATEEDPDGLLGLVRYRIE
ncbi:MAG: hypothetical protein R3B35_00575 [Gemmatimonadales bacterium]